MSTAAAYSTFCTLRDARKHGAEAPMHTEAQAFALAVDAMYPTVQRQAVAANDVQAGVPVTSQLEAKVKDACRAGMGPYQPNAVEGSDLPGWERGIATVTLTGHQLREALEFINPDGESEPEQLDDELTFGIVQHKEDDGEATTGLCCWNGDTDGVLPLDGKPAVEGSAVWHR